jgi:hypothetical protein
VSIRSADVDRMLSAEADALMWEFRRTVGHREVIHAVVRARIELRDADRSTGLDLPTENEYVALVMRIARQWIAEHITPTAAGDPIVLSDSSVAAGTEFAHLPT